MIYYILADKGGVTVMCVQRGAVSSDETRKMANDKLKQEIERLNVSATDLYETCLQSLKLKFQGEERELFYQSFENAYRQIYYKSRENKKRYWNKTSLVMFVLGTGGSGTVAAVSLFSIVRALLSVSMESGILAAITHSCAPLLLPFLLALGFLTACLFSEFERRNYRDTWVRHSVAYHRLNIAMVQYLSGLTGEEDFMKEVLRILETDIDRFERNTGVSQGSGT